MTQPIAQGDGFAGKIFMAGTAGNRDAATADILINPVDQDGTNAATTSITFENLDGCSIAFGTSASEGVTLTII